MYQGGQPKNLLRLKVFKSICTNCPRIFKTKNNIPKCFKFFYINAWFGIFLSLNVDDQMPWLVPASGAHGRKVCFCKLVVS
jgi:RNA polymerase subunit RPABC4/transcription elongation factor Spt4